MKQMPALHDVYQARSRIRTLVRKTSLMPAPELADRCGAQSVSLKLECRQHTGAFKVRGAANKILSLGDEAGKRGVITFSTGNHGRAVAYVAAATGITAVVCLSTHVPDYRVAAIRKLGAEVSVKGCSQDEAEKNYRHLIASRRLLPVDPFDDPMIIAGQGTIALEILEDLPETDVLMIPLSGGGLLAGIAMVAKTINPRIHVVGLSLEESPAMLQSLKAGRPVEVEEKDSVADSLLGGIGHDNRYTLALVEKFTDEHLLITEEEIKDGMFHLLDSHQLVVEGAAALGVGALLNKKIDGKGKKVVALLTGSSIQAIEYIRIMQSRLSNGGERRSSSLPDGEGGQP